MKILKIIHVYSKDFLKANNPCEEKTTIIYSFQIVYGFGFFYFFLN